MTFAQRVAAVIREELGLEDFDGAQLFEGMIYPDDLAAAIVKSLGLSSGAFGYRQMTAEEHAQEFERRAQLAIEADRPDAAAALFAAARDTRQREVVGNE